MKERHKIPEEFYPEVRSLPTLKGKAFLDVCISICITGDNFGEFWTSSILGTINYCQRYGKKDNSSTLDIGHKIHQVMTRYMYDKYGARNLVFIIHLTGVCHVISERHEDVVEKVKEMMELEVCIISW